MGPVQSHSDAYHANLRRKEKPKYFKDQLAHNPGKAIETKQASPEELEAIRREMELQKNTAIRKQFIVMGVIVLLGIGLALILA